MTGPIIFSAHRLSPMNQPTPAAGLLSSGLIGYCRAGFEKELAGGSCIVAVQAHDSKEAEQAEKIFKSLNAMNIAA